jgi:hypothetical protein
MLEKCGREIGVLGCMDTVNSATRLRSHARGNDASSFGPRRSPKLE